VQIERTLGRTHLGSGEAKILGRGREAAMTKEDLDGALAANIPKVPYLSAILLQALLRRVPLLRI